VIEDHLLICTWTTQKYRTTTLCILVGRLPPVQGFRDRAVQDRFVQRHPRPIGEIARCPLDMLHLGESRRAAVERGVNGRAGWGSAEAALSYIEAAALGDLTSLEPCKISRLRPKFRGRHCTRGCLVWARGDGARRLIVAGADDVDRHKRSTRPESTPKRYNVGMKDSRTICFRAGLTTAGNTRTGTQHKGGG